MREGGEREGGERKEGRKGGRGGRKGGRERGRGWEGGRRGERKEEEGGGRERKREGKSKGGREGGCLHTHTYVPASQPPHAALSPVSILLSTSLPPCWLRRVGPYTALDQTGDERSAQSTH